ncbi:NADH:flavin oxidoreductase/NADH oxidase [Bradyrhizobium sp. U87765 SZCCT0131]|uniref:NADH:flavin oxidoreductase/NADH oxidase n=1 Tax=unclassified Bradyrhizobium TaxID=2631580 RepID=UPI001BAAF958|nr:MULTISPECIES: NADH:flavin oxidoreductase/NADH oxidase [unclassified Bradyrhizobium]MBR1221048.1 NADH:flavin oxidoreductase/NADH oxidase [Bradyrhizobium sp. U87765 SZCCT0131]MBR1260132.1 NADH:flavin oxidoreductase/NADH oxidase [Bradyrhizobium sp. U87765 SZCCT0134]MBR1307619.1 NADH:flavin oxidoreductase/NADH oxidase [Bradyrhizobium sp. U87765 SZCCT0110]MBR1321573.1 NADH:flavin oxidoreductase/NADH oxidase [Bradyrhizobium sp. U87765 SZCCT0109]MBR1349886.1 NADH:flavin oxidoreductase/NADH oxidase
MSQPRLFTPITLRGVTARNRLIISPMCQYSADSGMANDWHLVHLGKFAQGGAGIVMTEATAVVAEGRITHGDLGIWSDAQVAPLARIATFLRNNGAVPAIQLAHAGRKASMQRPWYGNAALTAEDHARGDVAWPIVAPSAIAMDEGWLTPHELGVAELGGLRDRWRAATLRAAAAGFEVLEIHCAHGYLLHEFLSPLSNKRTDAYGGDLAGRMRFPLEIIAAVREVWPDNRPLFVRISSVDGIDGGWTLGDSVAFAREAKVRGVDVIDCSSGGLMGSATAARLPRGYGFQVPFAAEIRKQAGIATMAVGLILHPQQAEDILAADHADIVAVGREALFDPNWPLHAELELSGRAEGAFDAWPKQYGWWLERREPGLRRLDGPALPFRGGAARQA